MSSESIYLDGATEPHHLEANIGGGSMVAFTAPSPDRVTENEDCVAAIPYGPSAVVLAIADGAGGLPGGTTRGANSNSVAGKVTEPRDA